MQTANSGGQGPVAQFIYRQREGEATGSKLTLDVFNDATDLGSVRPFLPSPKESMTADRRDFLQYALTAAAASALPAAWAQGVAPTAGSDPRDRVFITHEDLNTLVGTTRAATRSRPPSTGPVSTRTRGRRSATSPPVWRPRMRR